MFLIAPRQNTTKEGRSGNFIHFGKCVPVATTVDNTLRCWRGLTSGYTTHLIDGSWEFVLLGWVFLPFAEVLLILSLQDQQWLTEVSHTGISHPSDRICSAIHRTGSLFSEECLHSTSGIYWNMIETSVNSVMSVFTSYAHFYGMAFYAMICGRSYVQGIWTSNVLHFTVCVNVIIN